MGATGGSWRHAAAALPTSVSAALLVPGGVAAAYLGALTMIGTRSPRRGLPNAPRHRLAILVPAHDEASGIADTLRSFAALDYPADLVSVHVVADNCTDATAEVVRAHGYRAHERTAPDDPGKGPALNWLRDRLIAEGEPFDAVVVVDADTSLDEGFLRAADATLARGATVAQGYYSVREPDASPSTSFRYTALACRHYLRPLGRTRLGGSCGLYGNGMVFTRELISEVEWTGHLVEDAELQNELLLRGVKVAFVPGAVLFAEMPRELGQARSQNARWERGRIELARRYVPTIARRVLTGPQRAAAADAVLDHLTPPLSALVGIQVVGALAGAAGGLLGDRRRGGLALAHLVSLALVAGHTFAGLVAVRAPARHYLALLGAPRQVVWKIAVWARAASGREVTAWTRTRRNAEQPVES